MLKMFTRKEKVETAVIVENEEAIMNKMKDAMMAKIRKEMMKQEEAKEDTFRKQYVRWN